MAMSEAVDRKEHTLRRLASEVAGLLLLVAAVLQALLLLSFNHADPSWNHAVDAAPTNILGHPGAIIADLLFQGFGAAAALLPLVLLHWSVQLLLGHGLRRFWARLLLLLPALLLTALALAALPAPNGWPVAAGLGGVAGSLSRHGLALAGADGVWTALAAALAAALVAALLFCFVAGVPVAPWIQRFGGEKATPKERGESALPRLRRWIAAPFLRLMALFARREREQRHEPSLAAAPAPAATPSARRRSASVDLPARPARRDGVRQKMLDLGPPDRHLLPPLELLTAPPPVKAAQVNEEALQQNARMLESVLEDFGVRGQIVKVRPGPVVTLYELEPAPGIKASRIIGLADDIARSMSAISARVAVVPGRNVIGIELPNAKAETVYLRELLASEAYERTQGRLQPRARQGHRRRPRRRRSRPHAASAHRRHHRLRQIGRHQHHHPLDPLSPAARAVPLHHDRS